MRVALVGEGTRGDVHPMLALASWLQARGHETVLCAPPDFAADAADRELPFHPIGNGVRAFLRTHAREMEGGLSALRIGTTWSCERVGQQFAALPDAVAGCELVVGAGLSLAARSVAEASGIPYRYLAYCPILLPSAAYPPFIVPRASLPGWLNRLAWASVRPLLDRTLRPVLNRGRARLGLAPVRDVYHHMLTGRPVLAADRELAPVPPDVTFEVDSIPCLHPLEGDPLPPKLRSFLDAGPAPVYFGFGSMTDSDPERTTRTVLAVVERLGGRALVSQGWAGIGAGALPDGVLAIGSVSHARLFPRCAAVVHHGGAGTTTTAARAGVPQVVAPHVADQFYWGRRVWELGVGPPPIRKTRLDAEGLHAALAATLDAESVRERALDLGARLRAALPAELDALPSRLGLRED